MILEKAGTCHLTDEAKAVFFKRSDLCSVLMLQQMMIHLHFSGVSKHETYTSAPQPLHPVFCFCLNVVDLSGFYSWIDT